MERNVIKEGISIIIPLYNEEEIVEKEIGKLSKSLDKLRLENYEILLVENGSTDKTWEIVKKLSASNDRIRPIRLKDTNYGNALKRGLADSRFERVFQFDIDFIDTSFMKRAMGISNTFDIIIGSKLLPASKDSRPFNRIIVTKLVNLFVKNLGYMGTDTHGIKMYKREKIIAFVPEVKATHHFFDTELILRTQNAGLKIKEIPVFVKEIRRTRFPFRTRLVQTILEFLKLRKNMAKLKVNTNPYTFDADDYGYDKESVKNTEKLISGGKIQTFNVLANLLLTRQKNSFLRGKKTGLHFNLVEGKPISKRADIKTLVGEDGKFYSRNNFLFRLLLGLLSQKDIEKELKAQFEHLKLFGPKINALNSHDHMHAFSPVAEAVEKLAIKKKIKVRSYRNFKPYSLQAKFTYVLMKCMAFLSHIIYFRKWGLPPSWKKSGDKFTFMSMETALPGEKCILVIHPGLSFDRTKEYEKFF